MTKLIKVQKGQDGAVLATASDAALNDAKPVPVMDVAEVVALEQRIAQEGTSLYTLMTRAGKAVAEAVRQARGDRVPARAGEAQADRGAQE